MWNPLIRKKPEKNNALIYNSRIHVEQPMATSIFEANFSLFITQFYEQFADLIILCIGTDRSTGDSLGPLVGSKLLELGFKGKVYGTLEEPVHAVNLQQTIDTIKKQHQNPFIIAIDACLGRSESVGYISIKEGPLQPGTGVNKDLPAVGDLQIIGIVNIGGFMEYMVLQNTRLSLVMKMADIISQGLYRSIKKISYFEPLMEERYSPIEPIHT